MSSKLYGLEKRFKSLARKTNPVDYRLNVFKLYLYNLFMGFYLLSGVLIPFYLIWGRLTFMEFMILQSYYALIILIFEIPFGALSDYIGKKVALFLSGVVSAISTLIYSTRPGIVFFIIGETLFAFGEALIAGSNEALMYDSLKNIGKEKEFPKMIAKSNAIFILSMAFSAPFGPIIAFNYSFSLVMIIMFFPYLFGAIISLTFHEPITDSKRERTKFVVTLKSGFKVLKSNKVLRVLTFDMIIIDILILFLLYTYQLYLIRLNVPFIYFGFIASSYYFIEVAFTVIVPKFENQIKDKKKYLVINTITPGIAYILIGITIFTPIIVILILIIFGVGFSRYILFVNGINNQINIENRATVLNTISTIRLLLKAILLPIIGFLVLQNLNYIFIIIGLIIIIFAMKSRIKNEYLE